MKSLKQILIPAMLGILAIVLGTVLNTEANKVTHGRAYDEAILKGFEDGRNSIALEYYVEPRNKNVTAVLEDVVQKVYINPFTGEPRYIILRPGTKLYVSNHPY
jgi:hypothetical protein